MKIIVQKFGGTSLADLDRIKNAAKIVQKEIDNGNMVIAIVSAMAGVTNSLVSKCSKLSMLDSYASLREYDAALASGEIVSAALLALELHSLGIMAKSLQGWQAGIVTNNSHQNAHVIRINNNVIKDFLSKKTVPIITGFQGVTENNEITTLGKGGSDTSAALIAAYLKDARCDIYTDVDGIYTADPRIVHCARRIEQIDHMQLYHLCASGAKILHARAALAVIRYNLELRILSSFSANTGTKVIKLENKAMERREVTAITSNKNLLRLNIETLNDAKKVAIIRELLISNIPILYSYMAKHKSLEIITNISENGICLNTLDRLKGLGLISDYSTDAKISSVSIIGYGLKDDTLFVADILQLLSDNNIDIYYIKTSDLKICIFVNDQLTEKTIQLLHKFCFENI